MGSGHNNVSGHLFTTDGNAVALPVRVRPLPRHPGQPRADLPEHGGLQRAAAERRALLTGSSTTRPTGSSRCTSCRSPAASPARSRPVRSARCSRRPRLGPAGHQQRSGRRTATARSCRATRTSSTATTTRSASSACASSPAAWRNEIFLDVYERAGVVRAGRDRSPQRSFDAYAAGGRAGRPEPRRRHLRGRRGRRHGQRRIRGQRAPVPAGDVATTGFAVTREINDGMLAPRFAPQPACLAAHRIRASVNPVGARVHEGVIPTIVESIYRGGTGSAGGPGRISRSTGRRTSAAPSVPSPQRPRGALFLKTRTRVRFPPPPPFDSRLPALAHGRPLIAVECLTDSIDKTLAAADRDGPHGALAPRLGWCPDRAPPPVH